MISSTHLLPQQQQNTQQHPFYNQSIDIDSFESDASNSIASSPHSTQSLLSQYSNFQSTPLPTTFDAARFKFPSTLQQNVEDASSRLGSSHNLGQVPDLMPSDMSWVSQLQQTPRGLHRLGHHRESSLSSLGSNGPASPYTANTSNPQIAVTDSSDYSDIMNGGDGNNYSYQAAKQIPLNDNFYPGLHNLQTYTQKTNVSHPVMDGTFSDGMPRQDRNLLPAPELTGGSIGSSSRSHPASVASSIVGGDSPATPSMQEPMEDFERRRKNVFNHTSVPKLDRTMTDVYNDELYSPNFTITSASPSSQAHLAMSPSNELFNQRLQAANSQHLNATQSPISASSGSPFRQGSPYATSVNDFSASVHIGSAQQIREKRKAEQDAKMQQQMAASSNQQAQQQGTPSTISPKDAMLEFNESEDGANNFPLFSAHETNNFGLEHLSKSVPHVTASYQAATAPVQSTFNFSMPTSIAVPQQYPFIARPQQQQHLQQAHQHQPQVAPSTTFSRMNSTETSNSDGSDGSLQKPSRAGADGGTYTCTYHGCTLRFDTPALLQKHKREGHRQANALNAARASPASGMTSSFLNSQAGPHRCDRINPSTGKPCNTVFSRPYDLTRHEDTIHNARKQKVRCDLCTEEKTFSRADALTRHYRVCHPDVELPGKHRRRAGLAA